MFADNLPMIYVTPIGGLEYELEPFFAVNVATHPRPQPRPRHHKGRVFSNSKLVARFKNDIRMAIAMQRRNSPPPGREVPVFMELEIGMPVKDKRKWGRFHTGRPDGDNILKAVKDVIVDSGVLEDDSQIVACNLVKRYCAEPGHIRVIMGVVR